MSPRATNVKAHPSQDRSLKRAISCCREQSRVGALCRRLKNLLSATSLWTTLHKNFSFAKPHTALTNARLQHAKSYEAAKSTKSALQAGLAFPHSVGLRTQTGLAWKYPTQIGKPLTQSQPSLTQSKIGVTQPSSTGLGLDPGLIASSKQALSTTYLICKGLWGQGLMGA